MFEEWLKNSVGLSTEAVGSLTAEQRQNFMTKFIAAQEKATPAPTPALAQPGSDGAGQMGEDLSGQALQNFQQQLNATAIAHNNRVATINAELGEWPELVTEALTNSWDAKDIEIAKLKKQAENNIGRDYSVITSKGSAKDVKMEDAVEVAFSASLQTPLDVLEKGIYNGLSHEERIQLGDVDDRKFDEPTIEAGLKLRKRAGGVVSIGHLCAAAMDGSIFAGFDTDTDFDKLCRPLSNSAQFSTVRLQKWLKDCFNREMISQMRRMPTKYQDLVRIISGSYRPTKRYRVYDVGSMGEVPKGGQIENQMSLDARHAYDTALNRYGMMFFIDECMIDDGDLGSVQDHLTMLTATARFAPEEIFFEMLREKHCTGENLTNGKIEFSQRWWDAAWKCYYKSTSKDPKDPANEGCGIGRALQNVPMTMIINGCHMPEATRMLLGVPQLCGNASADECAVIYTGNIYGDNLKICFTSEIPEDCCVIVPQENALATSHVMTVKNNVRVPIVRGFDAPPNKLGFLSRAVFRFGIDEADEHLQKSGADVNAYLEELETAPETA